MMSKKRFRSTSKCIANEEECEKSSNPGCCEGLVCKKVQWRAGPREYEGGDINEVLIFSRCLPKDNWRGSLDHACIYQKIGSNCAEGLTCQLVWYGWRFIGDVKDKKFYVGYCKKKKNQECARNSECYSSRCVSSKCT